jgi:hypothetical protein
MAIGRYYNTLTLLRQGSVSINPMGGQIVDWVTIPFKGIISRKQSQTSNTMGKSGELTDAVLICEIRDLKKGDRVRNTDGIVYVLKGDPSDVMNRGHHLECDLQRLTGVDI